MAGTSTTATEEPVATEVTEATAGGDSDSGPTGSATATSGSSSDTTGAAETDAPTTAAESETSEPAPFCGDGTLDADEQCDEGANNSDNGYCTASCQTAVCGDALVSPGEGCDDGNEVDDDACTNACALASCGDGTVQPGEGCDDGNPSNEDACTNNCTEASCGDGFKQPGEACDAGADNDDGGACTLACALAVCGDGLLQMSSAEECDDGNQSDVDACVGTCKLAKCGDGLVWADMETCDDSNQVDDDLCSNACQTATCEDGQKNAAETDADCGGAECPKCDLGDTCAVDLDCSVGRCLGNVCVAYKSCKALLEVDNTLKDGKYTIDPDEGGPVPAFEAYCDMTHDGGGWTLIMKAIETNFLYDDALWENNLTLNPADFDFTTKGKKAKYPSFMTVGFSELRTSATDGASAHVQKLAAPVASATALFTGPAIELGKGMLLPYFENIHGAYDRHWAACNPSAKFVNYGINLKKQNGLVPLPDGGFCDWNGGARFGMRVNANHNNTGNHAGQGWGTYTTVDPKHFAIMTQLLWVR